ncbi:MAG: hypothetical protein H8E44_03635 [Planctomycetes bacterium]|nr:hypothetical protein [Planctomycetota bacterium]MBL7041170.1 hypothetical protein [Pirellulaceae bacterium]
MSMDPHQIASLFHIDVTPETGPRGRKTQDDGGEIVIDLLQQLVIGQERQNKLLEDLVQQSNSTQKQRASELGQWKEANPGLARQCRAAAETLSRVQNEFLHNLTDEVTDNEECLLDGEFVLNEFVDRYGPRLAHLNGVLQVLSQLSTTPDTASAPQQ